jgi:hypothetical protein
MRNRMLDSSCFWIIVASTMIAGCSTDGSELKSADSIPSDEVCVSIIKTHGFLSRAQFQCGFEYYSNEMIQEAKTCSETLPENEKRGLLKLGMQLFDRNEKERGHVQICEDILRDFPKILRK